ncbi:UBA domain-containing protein [Histoplasma capsulatum var. duboisii H88]|uniref:UBA domain-containing protein n=1 Tax=Ajellomyces capsulatus (strain H88) TaxID=544711 RepID=A0A8A1LA01_AJEC8|nr:UBA domain-containing protein [Histoplasma capsulatum var. duboisii H88]
MASALSKRQQARNERALQELIKSVPGNDRCADCQARNPGWASWNLGVFLCVRCATLHRKLGTHISKVKSLTMDSWSSDQVDNMKRNGNAVVNKLYNPRNVKPPIPIDVDEVDSAMERFIRQKYELKVLEDGRPKPPSRHDPSYTATKGSDRSPPPLPPKTGRRLGFGLRSASYSNAVSSSEKSPPGEDYAFSTNRQSRNFGASVVDSDGTFGSKLEALRDMGFPNHKRNATILRGLNGNMDKTIESLVRLGEGPAPRSRSQTPVPKVTPTASQFPEPVRSPKSTASNNPFDNLDSAPSRAPSGSAVSQAEQQPAITNGAKSYNPFDFLGAQTALTQPTQSLDQSFQQLQVSQPLFPNITGGYPSQQGQIPFQRSQQSMTPPVTMSSQNGLTASPAPMNGAYNPFFQNVQPVPGNTNNNPYFDQPPGFSPTNPFFNVSGQAQRSQSQTLAPGNGAGNVNQFQRYSTMPAFSSSSAFPQQQQPQPQQYVPQEQQSSFNPFTLPTIPPSNPSYQPQFDLQPTPQTLMSQHTGKIDKSSILALYNFSQPPPTIPEQPAQQSAPNFTTQPQQQPQQQQQHQNSAAPFSLSNSNSRNPYHTAPPNAMSTPGAALTSALVGSRSQMGFAPAGVGGGAGSGGGGVGNTFPRTHMSQASVDIGGVQNGRHSPDVFASLSSRYVR